MVGVNNFRVATDAIHSQRFEDEVVVLDTLTGLYFSLRGSAIDIWAMVQPGASRSAVIASLTARYEGEPEMVSAGVDRCLSELLRYGLVREAPSSNEVWHARTEAKTSKPFTDPVIEHFTDMQDLLLLDPVHDVSEMGWPHPNPEAV